ncbi:unnamed protein product [Somion occarium]|uniref:Uncharacterized protein n=1 Tax=Somion occarium TaxID=3059160 RepID=A0ABP1CRE9_9APHY
MSELSLIPEDITRISFPCCSNSPPCLPSTYAQDNPTVSSQDRINKIVYLVSTSLTPTTRCSRSLAKPAAFESEVQCRNGAIGAHPRAVQSFPYIVDTALFFTVANIQPSLNLGCMPAVMFAIYYFFVLGMYNSGLYIYMVLHQSQCS